MYHSSSTNSTNTIGNTHKISPKTNLFENISGKNINMTKIKLKYAKIHINVGTGHLTHFKSAPGLSNILHFLKTKSHNIKITAIKQNDNI